MKDRSDFSYGSPTVPEGAVFIAGDLVSPVYPSAIAAGRDLNPIYVENGRYTAAYGREGQRYRIVRQGRGVALHLTGEPDAPNELRELLIGHLKTTHQALDETASNAALAGQIWRTEREFWAENDPYGDRFARSIPWWGCLLVLGVFGALAYSIVWLVRLAF